MSFIAKFSGTCSDCAEEIKVGDFIERDDSPVTTYHHVECPDPFPEEPDLDDPLSVKPGETLCPSCFLVHKGECF